MLWALIKELLLNMEIIKRRAKLGTDIKECFFIYNI